MEYLIACMESALVKVHDQAVKVACGSRSFNARFLSQVHSHELVYPNKDD